MWMRRSPEEKSIDPWFVLEQGELSIKGPRDILQTLVGLNSPDLCDVKRKQTGRRSGFIY
jgi:hypothetical protein